MARRNAELSEPGASLGGQMGVIYVARRAKFSKWASDAGVTKNVFKIGYSENDPAPLIAAGWGGETDWTLVKQCAAEGVTEEEIIERLKRKEKMIDPVYYPGCAEWPACSKCRPSTWRTTSWSRGRSPAPSDFAGITAYPIAVRAGRARPERVKPSGVDA